MGVASTMCLLALKLVVGSFTGADAILTAAAYHDCEDNDEGQYTHNGHHRYHYDDPQRKNSCREEDSGELIATPP